MVWHMNWKNIEPFVPFFQKISNPTDDYELGIAYATNTKGQESFLLSYNPRKRTRAFRKKIITTFRHFGFPIEPVLDLYKLILPHECSWVIGLEYGKTLRTTIYIEELSQFFTPTRLTQLIDFLQKKWNIPPLSAPKFGNPYILALDIQPTGIQYLKQYNFLPNPQNIQLIDEQKGKPLLIQTRSGCPQQKIYACYPYLQSPTPNAWEDWQSLSTQYNLNPKPFDKMTITSIGIRFDPNPNVFGLYGCVVQPKGDNKASSSPNI